MLFCFGAAVSRIVSPSPTPTPVLSSKNASSSAPPPLPQPPHGVDVHLTTLAFCVVAQTVTGFSFSVNAPLAALAYCVLRVFSQCDFPLSIAGFLVSLPDRSRCPSEGTGETIQHSRVISCSVVLWCS